MVDQSRSRTAARLVASSSTAFASLAILNVLLPTWLGPAEFAEWRQISLALALAGVCHLGLGEGLYIWWVRHPTARQSRRSFSRNSTLAVLASAVYAVFTCLTQLVPWPFLALVFVVTASYAVYAMALSFVQTHSDHRRYVPMFILQPVGLATAVAAFGVTGHATPETAAAATALSYVAATVYIVRTGGVIVARQANRPDDSVRALLWRPNKGIALLVANMLYLLLVNIDKLIFNHRYPDTLFASYSLLTVLPNAMMSLFGPVGIVLFARGALIRRRRFLVIGLAAVVVAVGLVLVQVGRPVLDAWYVGFDLDGLSWFALLCGVTLTMSLYYVPRLRVTRPRMFLTSLAVYSAVASLVFSFVPNDLAGDPMASFACVNVILLTIWLLVLDFVDRDRPSVEAEKVHTA